MTDGQSIFENEWCVPITLCICGVLSVAIVLRRPSAYWVVLAVLQFSMFFMLLMFRNLWLSRIFLGFNACTMVGNTFVRSWHQYTQHRPVSSGQFVSDVLLGSLLIGLILRVFKSTFVRKEREDESITQLNI